MKRFRLLPAWIVPLLALAAVPLALGPSAAWAEEEKPPAPAGPTDPAMGEPGAEDPVDEDEEEDIPKALDEKIKIAIERGVAWLKSAQKPDGSWGPIEGNSLYGGGKSNDVYKHPAGSTALALFTLLKCKVPLDDPVVKKGFAFLRAKHQVPGGSYECSMMLLAVTATADPFKKTKASVAQAEKVRFPGGDWRGWADRLHKKLLEKRQRAKTKGWRYNIDNGNIPPGGNQDMSSTQLASLALLAADRCGIRTDDKVWLDIIDFTLAQQESDGPEWDRAVYDRPPKAKDGSKLPTPTEPDRYGPSAPAGGKPVKDKARGFAYILDSKLPADEGQPTGGMTACGVGNLMMARYILLKRDAEKWQKNPLAPKVQQAIYDGCAWLDQNFSAWENPQKRGMNVYHVYYLYCSERAFDLIGNLLLGKHPWYQEMAEQIVGRQSPKGFWNSDSTHKPNEVLDTCFALLFLKRSTKGGIPYGSITGGSDEPPTDNRGR